jgi:hypothetical protein
MATQTTIPMIDPQGEIRMIPLDQRDAALKSGGKVAIKMKAPDGSQRWIATDEFQDAVKAGGRPVPLGGETTAPKGSPVSRFLSSGLDALKSGASGVASMVEPKTAADVILGPAYMAGKAILGGAVDQGKQAVDSAKKGQKSLAAGHALAAILPGVGPWAAQVGEQVGTQAGQGDYAGAAGTLAGNAALYEAPHVLGKLPPALREGFRKAGQTTLGLSERAVSDEVAKTAEKANTDAETVKEKNKAADERTMKDRGAVDEKNAEKARKDEAARAETLRKNKGAAEAHRAEKEKIDAENREAIRQRDKLTPTKEKLESASAEMRSRIETAREKASEVGDAKYKPLNEKLGHFQADPEVYEDALSKASEALRGSKTEPTLLSQMSKKWGAGEVPTYSDLQGDYSALGKELTKGTLPGDVYHAYDELHEALGTEMQRIADSQGMGAQLLDARNYWRRMKQTFGKPLTMADNATAALKDVNPEFLSHDAQANRLRLLGSFDPEIPKAAEHIGNLRKGMDALPKDQPVRAAVKVPPPAPSPEPLPKPTPRAEYPEPHATTPIEKPTVDTREIRADRMMEKANRMRTYALNRAAYTAAAMLPGSLLAGIMGHPWFGTVIEAGSVPLGVYGGDAFANMLGKPGVRNFLTKPPAGELERLRSLPHADRIIITDGMKPIVDEAKKRGVNVSPALLTALGASAFPKKHALHREQPTK